MNNQTLRMLIGIRGFSALCAVSLVTGLSTGFAAENEPAETIKTIPVPSVVQESLQQQGYARVIIGLNADFKPEGQLTPDEIAEQHAKIARAQEQFLTDLKNTFLPTQEQKYATVPYVAIYINDAALQYIQQHPLVTSIELDAIAAPVSENGQ